MKRFLSIGLVGLISIFPFAMSAATTSISLRFERAVTSATAKVGDVVPLTVAEDVKQGDQVVVAAGTHVEGRVTRARRRGHNRREGQVIVSAPSVQGTDGRQYTLVSAGLKKGTGEGQPIFGPCTFPLPADPVGLFRKGQDVVIPAGTTFVASLAE